MVKEFFEAIGFLVTCCLVGYGVGWVIVNEWEWAKLGFWALALYVFVKLIVADYHSLNRAALDADSDKA